MRKIIHIDMDAFFASVEQKEDPSLKGQAVIVGGSPDTRGVVAAASYEARKFGVRSAMPSSQAIRLCPKAVIVRPRFHLYRSSSKQIMEILSEYSDLVEPLSLDEAYLDVTINKKGIRSATETAQLIKDQIKQQTQLTASAGVAPNKFLAKVASDMNKPDGLTVIPPDKVNSVLQSLPVRKVPGIGKVTEQKMSTLGISTTGDLKKLSEEELTNIFGKQGAWYYRIARGIDPRAVNSDRIRKSLGKETTFHEDTISMPFLREQIVLIAEKVSQGLLGSNTSGRTLTLKITYGDFEKITRSRTLSQPFCDPATLEETSISLLDETEAGQRPIRLLGISVSNLDNQERTKTEEPTGPKQLELPFISNDY